MTRLLASVAPIDFYSSYVWPFAAALAVTLLTCPFVRRIAIRLDLYDRPDSGLKPHERPIPYLGGVAMYLGWLAALVCAVFLTRTDRLEIAWIVVGGTLLMLTGLADDIRHLSPKFRLLVQAIVAGLLMYGGIGRECGRALIASFADDLPGWAVSEPVVLGLSAAVCIFALAGAMNAANFIDGMDGLCAGILGIAAVGFFYVSLAVPPAGDVLAPVRAALCAAIFGACLGFLFFNSHPASIFMGDSGSLLLGYSTAVVMILLMEHPTCRTQPSWRWFDGALIAFAVPVLDTGLAIGRRWINHRPLFTGDRSHLYDQLRDRGLTIRQTVLTCYAIGAGFAALGPLAVRLTRGQLFVLLMAIPLVAAMLFRAFGMLRVDDTAARSRAGGA
ncbi:MAG TPA: MraY family glycosyltransferase [Phycisphaerae bacterium]|nr:MraY family glycosyltransferase [Phycisphaerae bacterium]